MAPELKFLTWTVAAFANTVPSVGARNY